MGVINPVVPPMQFIIPYKVPAKFGDKSWEFWMLVIAEAPLNPNDIVRNATAATTSHPVHVRASKSNPGIK